MKHLLPLALVAALSLVACEGDTITNNNGPTAPLPADDAIKMSAKFDCLENAATTTLTCTDATTGGVRPYTYNWFADFKEGRVAVSQNTVVWNYSKQCSDSAEKIVVVVRLEVRDSDDQAQEDTTELPFTVCELAHG